MISDEVIDALVDAGATAEMLAAAIKASRGKGMSNAERQAKHRAKVKAAVDADTSVVTESNVTISSDRNDRDTKGFSLSPVPLLSPTPPNNPLTPKPSSKNSLGARDFGDWPGDFRTVFWVNWPNKVGKPAAMRALDACRKRGVSFASVIDGIGRYIRTKPPDRAWLNPATFLNQDRFDDQPAEITDAKPESLATVAKRQADAGISFGPRPTGLRLVEGGGDVRLLPEAGRERSGDLRGGGDSDPVGVSGLGD